MKRCEGRPHNVIACCAASRRKGPLAKKLARLWSLRQNFVASLKCSLGIFLCRDTKGLPEAVLPYANRVVHENCTDELVLTIKFPP